MDRTVMWMQWNNLGMEQLHLENGNSGNNADGVVVGIKEGRAFRIRYQIDTDSQWRVQQLKIELLNRNSKKLHLKSDGAGYWQHGDGTPIPELNGCIDLDLSATPFTNTLAIRRLALQPGDVQNLSVVFVAVPEMEVRAVPQRYTCLETNSQGGMYKYEGLLRNFSADLLVDRDGLVIEYPNAFRRVWSVEEPR
jgi:hypothetical protein